MTILKVRLFKDSLATYQSEIYHKISPFRYTTVEMTLSTRQQ